MKTRYHREITTRALAGYFSANALEEILQANVGQDALRYQVSHDHYHYDSNAFLAGDAYCAEQRGLFLKAARGGESLPARQALGRLTHTVQDLYAHSNYVNLWCEAHPAAGPEEIDPEDAGLLKDGRLHSGNIYYPLEVFAFIPALQKYVLPLLPKDSHAWMNLDGPERAGFEHAFAAAVKRSEAEYTRLAGQLTAEELVGLSGKAGAR